MYDINKYLNPPKKRTYYPDTPIVHDDEARKSQDVTNGYDIPDDKDDIAESDRLYSVWNSTINEYTTRTVESDQYRQMNAPTGRRKHQPHYENRFSVDISSFVCITRRKGGIEITGASDEMKDEIQANSDRLPLDVTITHDEYTRLLS